MLTITAPTVTVGHEWIVFVATCSEAAPTFAQVYLFAADGRYLGQWNMVSTGQALSLGVQRSALSPGNYLYTLLVRNAANADTWVYPQFLPLTVPPLASGPSSTPSSLSAPIFPRAYHGAKTGNANRLWKWTPGGGVAPTSYRLRLAAVGGPVVEEQSVPATATSYLYREHFQNYRWPKPGELPLPQGDYLFSVTAVKGGQESPPVVDPFTISYFLDPAITDMGKQDMGLAVVSTYFPPGQEIKDGIALRYKFQVVENEGAEGGGKILFGATRLADATGEIRPFALQQNFYTSRSEYTDPICDAEYPPFDAKRQEACLVLALSDYEKTGQIGAKTYDPAMLPRCFSLIDGRPELPNITLRLQKNMNGKFGQILVERGGIITNKDGWKCQPGRLLDTAIYREWITSVTVDGQNYRAGMALPANVAQYLSFFWMLNFAWEFPLQPGAFVVRVWDAEVLREYDGSWHRLDQWYADKHVGYTTDFGFRAVTLPDGRRVLEASNLAPSEYVAQGTVFTV